MLHLYVSFHWSPSFLMNSSSDNTHKFFRPSFPIKMLPLYFGLRCTERSFLKALTCLIDPIRLTGLSHLYIPYVLQCLGQCRSVVIFSLGTNSPKFSLLSTNHTFTNYYAAWVSGGNYDQNKAIESREPLYICIFE